MTVVRKPGVWQWKGDLATEHLFAGVDA